MHQKTAALQSGEKSLDVGHRDNFSAHENPTHRAKTVRLPLDQRIEECCRDEEHADSSLGDEARQVRQIKILGRINRQSRTIEQGTPYFEGGSIERKRCELQKHIVRPDINVVCIPDQSHHTAVRNHHAFRLAGAPGGVANVGQVFPSHVGEIDRWTNTAIIIAVGHVQDRPRERQDRMSSVFRFDHGDRCRVLDYAAKSSGRIRGTERKISGTRFENSEQTHHRLGTADTANTHQITPTNSRGNESAREVIRPSIQLAVRKR